MDDQPGCSNSSVLEILSKNDYRGCSDAAVVVLAELPEADKPKILEFFRLHKCLRQNIEHVFEERECGKAEIILENFWKSLAPHHYALLKKDNAVFDVIYYDDSVFHMNLIKILVSAEEDIDSPSALSQLLLVAKNWATWEAKPMSKVYYQNLTGIVNAATLFASSVDCQRKCLQLQKTIQESLIDDIKVARMCTDMYLVDPGSYGKMDSCDMAYAEALEKLKYFLRRQAPVQAYIAWMEGIVKKAIARCVTKSRLCMKKISAISCEWDLFREYIITDLQSKKARSLHSLDELCQLLVAIVHAKVDARINEDKQKRLLRPVNRIRRKGLQNRQSMNPCAPDESATKVVEPSSAAISSDEASEVEFPEKLPICQPWTGSAIGASASGTSMQTSSTSSAESGVGALVASNAGGTSMQTSSTSAESGVGALVASNASGITRKAQFSGKFCGGRAQEGKHGKRSSSNHAQTSPIPAKIKPKKHRKLPTSPVQTASSAEGGSEAREISSASSSCKKASEDKFI